MAYIDNIICSKCHKPATVCQVASQRTIDTCGECTAKEKKKDRDNHLANLERLTIEARIRRIEAWIYDYKLSLDPMSVRF